MVTDTKDKIFKKRKLIRWRSKKLNLTKKRFAQLSYNHNANIGQLFYKQGFILEASFNNAFTIFI